MHGNSKYKKISLKKVEQLAGYGLTEVEIGNVLSVSQSAITTYKNKYPNFEIALKRGKDKADARVVASLYKRALGFEHTETQFEQITIMTEVGEVIKEMPAIKKKTIIKSTAPDTMACIYWLNNRRKEDWRVRPGEVGDKKYEDEMIEIIPSNGKAGGNGSKVPNRVAKFLS